MEDEVAPRTCRTRVRSNIMVVVDASLPRTSNSTKTWMDTFTGLLQMCLQKLERGDSLTLFGILETIVDAKTLPLEIFDCEIFNGASTTMLENTIQSIFMLFQQKCLHIKKECIEKEVHFQIMIKPGPLEQNKAVLEEMVGLDITSLILDRTMHKYKGLLSMSISQQSSSRIHKAAVRRPTILQLISSPEQWISSPPNSALHQGLTMDAKSSTSGKSLVLQPVCEQEVATSLFPTESFCGSSAPKSPTSSVHSIGPLDYEAFCRNDISYEESSVPSARSSFALDALDIEYSLRETKTQLSYGCGSSVGHESPCSELTSAHSFSWSQASTSGTIKKLTIIEALTSYHTPSIAAPKDTPSLVMAPISVQPRRASYKLLDILEQAAAADDELHKATSNNVAHIDGISTSMIDTNPVKPIDHTDPYFVPLTKTKYTRSIMPTFAMVAARKPQKDQMKFKDSGAPHASKEPQEPQSFTFEELEKATDKFSKQNLLANSTGGATYKGRLKCGRLVIIKENKLANFHNNEQFLAKFKLLWQLRHQNLAGIIGACTNKHVLVYEYVNNMSLDWHLAMSNPVTMNWHVRYKVAIAIARGLCFLHEGCCLAPVIHGDFRSKNILLTNEYEPKIADTALKWKPKSVGAEPCLIGASGYLAPEYRESGIDTVKTDVYAFGVVLLEIMTGMKANSRPNQQACLTEWARPLLQEGEIHRLMDKRIHESIVEKQIYSMSKIALLCIDKDPDMRPPMTQVVQILETAHKCSLESQDNMVKTKPNQKNARAQYTRTSMLWREGKPSTSRNPQGCPQFFMPTDCLEQSGFYNYTRESSYNPEQLPSVVSKSSQQKFSKNFPPPRTYSSQMARGLCQMPHQWQLPAPYSRWEKPCMLPHHENPSRQTSCSKANFDQGNIGSKCEQAKEKKGGLNPIEKRG